MTETMNLEETDPSGWMPTAAELRAEQAVLGAMMYPTRVQGTSVNSPAIDVVTRVISSKHLFRAAHREIMDAIVDLDQAGDAVDVLTVLAELEHRNALGRIGDATYLHTLIEIVPTVANAGYYAEQVLDAASRRATIELSQRIAQRATTDHERGDLAESVDKAYTDYVKVRDGEATTTRELSAADADELDEIEASWGTEDPGAFTTGITDLDRRINVGTGSLVVVAAMQGQGKSILGQTFARHYAMPPDLPGPNAGRGEPTVFFAMEMSKKRLQQRDLSALARIRSDTSAGKVQMQRDDWDRLAKAKAQYAQAPAYYIDDTSAVSIGYIRAQLRHLARKNEGRLGLVVVDYLGLMQMPERDRQDIEIGEVTRSLKLMAGEFDCVITLIAQCNRGPSNRMDGLPRVNDLKGSGSIEQDADLVLLLHDPGSENDDRVGELDVILAKQRDGATGPTIAVADQRHMATIGNLAP